MNPMPSGSELPELRKAAKCALPMIFTSLDFPESPGTHGTCTALRYGKDSVFVTAAHVLAHVNERTVVEVALGFRGAPLRCRIRKPLKPRPAGAQFEAVCDFAVMFPASPPVFVAGDSAVYDLALVARMEAAPTGSVFAACGYPKDTPDRNVIDYDARTATFGLHIAIGTYSGPSSFEGHHTLNVSTAELAGPSGFSGGPVFQLLPNKEADAWTPVLAGIVTMGGPNLMHFIDVANVATFIRGEVLPEAV